MARMETFQSQALPKLLVFERKCVESLPSTWKLDTAELMDYRRYHSNTQGEDPQDDIKIKGQYFREITADSQCQLEAKQLRALLAYMCDATTNITWDGFSPLVKPFYEIWAISAGPHYLEDIDQLTQDVMTHLKIMDAPQLSYIKKLRVIPNEDSLDTQSNYSMELAPKLRELILSCPNLESVDLLGVSRYTDLSIYRSLVRTLIKYLKHGPSIRHISLDMFLDATPPETTDPIHLKLTPTTVFRKYAATIAQDGNKEQHELAITIGRIGPPVPALQGPTLSYIAGILPQETTSVRFECMLANGAEFLRAFQNTSHQNLKQVAFGITPWTFIITSRNHPSNMALIDRCSRVSRGGHKLDCQIRSTFGAIDDRPLLVFDELFQYDDVERLCQTAAHVMGDSFGGIQLKLPALIESESIENSIIAKIVSHLPRIPKQYRIMCVFEHSFDSIDWDIPVSIDCLRPHLAERENVAFRLQDLAIGSILYHNPNDHLATSIGDRYPPRHRGTYEGFLEKVVPMLESARSLGFSFDRTYMHRKRHCFGEVALVLQETLPDLCGKHNLRNLSLGLGGKAGFPGKITDAWLRDELPASTVEEYMEPHIAHLDFKLLGPLKGLETLEIHELEIITPNHFDWLIQELPKMIPSTLKKLTIADIRLLVCSCPFGAEFSDGAGDTTDYVWLGAEDHHFEPVGCVDRRLDWKGELVSRMSALIREGFESRDEMDGADEPGHGDVAASGAHDGCGDGCGHCSEAYAQALGQGSSGLEDGVSQKSLQVVFANVTFWNLGPPIGFCPPFSRQERSTITQQLMHIYRGSPLVK